MRRVALLLLASSGAVADFRTVTLPSKSPLVTFRLVFTTGSASDPAGKEGLAYLTAMMLANGGTAELTYKQVVDALYPMAAGVGAQVDHEMCTFFRRHPRGQPGRVLQTAARLAADAGLAGR